MKRIHAFLIIASLLSCSGNNRNEFRTLYEEEKFEESVALFEAVGSNKSFGLDSLYYVALCYEAMAKPCDAIHLLYECKDSGEWFPELNEKIETTEASVLLSNCKLYDVNDERRFYRSRMFTSHYVEKYRFYFENNHVDSAVMALKAAIETKPLDASLYHELSRVYMQMNHFDSALTVQNEAVALRPDVAIFLANRGFVHHMLGRDDFAIEDAERANQLDTSNCEVYNFLIDLLKQNGKTSEIQFLQSKRPKNCD